MKKKLLLMGKSGSGKTSMRSVIFSNNPGSSTPRFGATLDYEQNHVRFFGDLVVNLWDCGGQDAFMKSYITSQKTMVFKDVGALVYVFDVETKQLEKDLDYYRQVLATLLKESKDARVFVLVHKMDLPRASREVAFSRKRRSIEEQSVDFKPTIFGTSIYDESLYEAWSRVVQTLMPNSAQLSRHLSRFATMCNAEEVVMFERTTFLVIASSKQHKSQESTSTDLTQSSSTMTMDPKRYERTSEIIKAFKHSCHRLHKDFQSLELEMDTFSAVLDELTSTTYILVVVHDRGIETEAIRMNIRLARPKFETMNVKPS